MSVGARGSVTLMRACTAADAPDLQSLYTASYGALLQADYGAQALTAALPKMVKPWPDLIASGSFFVVEVGGDLVVCGG